MNGFELNKIAASILLAGLVAMVVGNVTDILYSPDLDPKQRGYYVEVVADQSGGQVVQEAKVEFDIAALMKNANAGAGKDIFKKCASCHTYEKGGANRVGPNLYNVINAKKGHKGDYTYSSALLASEGEWNYKNLFEFLHKPRGYIKGTKMSFAGLNKSEDIANIIEFLRQEASDTPPALPAE